MNIKQKQQEKHEIHVALTKAAKTFPVELDNAYTVTAIAMEKFNEKPSNVLMAEYNKAVRAYNKVVDAANADEKANGGFIVLWKLQTHRW